MSRLLRAGILQQSRNFTPWTLTFSPFSGFSVLETNTLTIPENVTLHITTSPSVDFLDVVWVKNDIPTIAFDGFGGYTINRSFYFSASDSIMIRLTATHYITANGIITIREGDISGRIISELEFWVSVS